jgi:hypothetical protein
MTTSHHPRYGTNGRSYQWGIGGLTLSGTTAGDANGSYTFDQFPANGSVGFTYWPANASMASSLRDQPNDGDIADQGAGASPSSGALLRENTLISQGEGGNSSGEGGAASTLLTTLVAGDQPLTLSWTTWAFNSTGGFAKTGTAPSGSAAWASRALNGTNRPVTAAIVSRLLSPLLPSPPASADNAAGYGTGLPKQGTPLQFTLAAGATVQIMTTVLTSVTTAAAPADTLKLALADNAQAEPAVVVADAGIFWHAFWNRSSVTLPPKWAHVERFWYQSQYLLGMASRRGRIAPAIWGPWISADMGLWGGGYTLDIDAETPHQHMYAFAFLYLPFI